MVKYYCTHCSAVALTRKGRPATQLYDEDLHTKSNILRLLDCAECGLTADKYVEYDGALVLIDLVLQSRQAYRHVLLNGNYWRLILKMSLLSVICDGYICWASLPTSGEFFEQEYQFYVLCAKAALGLSVFVLTAMLASSSFTTSPSSSNLPRSYLLSGLLMAYSSRFCNLASFLWAPTNADNISSTTFSPDLMWMFAYLLFFMATVRAVQVCHGRGLVSSLVVAVVSHSAFLFMTNLDFVLNALICVE